MRKIERISISAADHERLQRFVREPKYAAEGGLEGASRVVGERWTDGGGDCGGGKQEPADGPPLAPPLRGEGGSTGC
jgi:hypothetical protein